MVRAFRQIPFGSTLLPGQGERHAGGAATDTMNGTMCHPGGNPGVNLKSISHRCCLREETFEWELTKEIIFASGLSPGWEVALPQRMWSRARARPARRPPHRDNPSSRAGRPLQGKRTTTTPCHSLCRSLGVLISARYCWNETLCCGMAGFHPGTNTTVFPASELLGALQPIQGYLAGQKHPPP